MAFKRLILLLLVGMAALTALSCNTAGDDPAGPDPGTPNFNDEFTLELTVYFRNDNYVAGNPAGSAVIPVTRSIPWTESVARATVNEIIRGPLPYEAAQYAVGPVISGAATLEDIYIQDGICVVHFALDGSLARLGERPVQEAEQFLLRSLLHSLTALPTVNAVWIFQNGSPWQGYTIGSCSPLAPPGIAVSYNLYFKENILDEFGIPASSKMAEPLPVELDSPAGTTSENCPLKQIIALLTADFDKERLAVLPVDNRALGFVLEEGLLTINLTGTAPLGHEASSAMIKSMVYTFTGLPEVDAVLATLNGDIWSDGHIVWEYHLRRQDLD